MLDSPLLHRLAVVLLAAMCIHSQAIETAHGPAVPMYCEVSGQLTMENCSLVNMALAEEFFNAAHAKHATAQSPSPRRVILEINTKCSEARARSNARTGGGSMDDVVERECRADEFHAAAMRLLGLRGKRRVIPANSTQLPSYCTPDQGNPADCMYINRLVAIDFFRRVVAAREATASGSSNPVTLEEVESICSASPQSAVGRVADSRELEKLKCVRDRLHGAALRLLH